MEKVVAPKAYQIDLSRIEEGFLCSPVFCHASSLNNAKTKLLNKIRHEGFVLSHSRDDITYLNIPVIRYEQADLIEFEGKYITQNQIDDIQQKRKRNEYFNSILENTDITHCYIRKHGSYYRPKASGYTSWQSFAGVYTKDDAVNHGRSCDDLQIIPINKAEHNKMIEDEIKDLQARVII